MSKSHDDESATESLAQRIRDLEELFMYLERTVRDLDQIVVEQGKQLAAIGQKLTGVADLVRSLSGLPGAEPTDPLDEKPPHY